MEPAVQQSGLARFGGHRTHTCSCTEQGSPALCPYHLVVEQVKWAKTKKHSFLFCTGTGIQTTKSGWAGTFEAIAQRLKFNLVGPTGLRLFTGHSARATGAVHMAPLEQLHGLAQEVSLKASILAATKEATAAATGLAHQPVEALADCEAAAIIEPPAPEPPENDVVFVRNRSSRGKVHQAACHGNTLPQYLWRTKCFWHFARGQADYMHFSKKSQTEQNAPNVSSSPRITKATGALLLPLPGRSRQSRNALRK